jgi:beta-lactamase regulating signal transducer with metallopeptidase domain
MNTLIGELVGSWSTNANTARLAWALLHFLWEGAVLAAVAWVLLALLARARPQVRYGVALLSLIAMAACPVVTYAVLAEREPARAANGRPAGPPASVADGRAVEVRPETARFAPSIGTIANPFENQIVRATDWLRRNLGWFVLGWLAGICIFSARLAAGLVGAERARRRAIAEVSRPIAQLVEQLADRMRIRRTLRVVESSLTEVPALVGWLRPVILLPACACTGLSFSQLEAILAHELAHVRRHDALVNLVQAIIETVLFYHPAVWWLSRSARQEREHCCDDVAVSVCADRLAYARALCAMEALRVPVPSLMVAARGGSLATRIRRIVGRPEPNDGSRLSLVAVALVLIVVVGATLPLRRSARASVPLASAEATVVEPALLAAQDQDQGKQAIDPNRPWTVFGRVIDASGKPLPGVTVHASTGMGSLRRTGEAASDVDGRYRFDFGPGFARANDPVQLQAATISAHKPGFAEKNLSRQGDLRAAFQLPANDAELGKTAKDQVFLPGKPKQIDFVMVPAAKVAGTLIDKDERPLAGWSVALTGDALPPSSNVVGSATTNEKGEFVLADVPPGFHWKFLIEPAERRPPWNAWACGPFVFEAGDGYSNLRARYGNTRISARRFELQILGEGINWRAALNAGTSDREIHVIGPGSIHDTHLQANLVRLRLAMPVEAERPKRD